MSMDRAYLKSLHLCVNCARKDARPNRVLCAACARKANARQAERRAQRTAAGQCPVCGEPSSGGYVVCPGCRKVQRDAGARFRARKVV